MSNTSYFDKDGLYFTALGGADEIGMSMYIYAHNGKFIMVDAGYGFLKDQYPGMDLCFADPSFFKKYASDFEGIFITHAHEDHFGAIAHVLATVKCPVYAKNYTISLMKNRLKEHHALHLAKMHSVNNNPVVKLPSFQVEFVQIAHSVPETSALSIKVGDYSVVHATDWRFDDGLIPYIQTDYERFKALGDEGVDLFVCDSTNILVPHQSHSEFEVRQTLMKLIPTLDNTVVATCFSSNLVRVESLIMAAELAGRTPVLVGRSLLGNVNAGRELGYFHKLEKCYDIKDKEVQDIPQDKALYICTGSQADYRSAMTTIASGMGRIKLRAGDNVIFSSKIIPGNEAPIIAMQEKFISDGINVITDTDALVHASGHCSQEEIRKMYDMLKPRMVLPVHGEKKFIRVHRAFARASGIEDVTSVISGGTVLITKNGWEEAPDVPTDIMAVDRNEIVSLHSEVVRRRRQIAYNGSVFISVIFGENWELLAFRISSKDIIEPEPFAVLRDKIIAEVTPRLRRAVKKYEHNEDDILEFVRSQVRRRIEKATTMRPVTFVHFYKLPEDDLTKAKNMPEDDEKLIDDDDINSYDDTLTAEATKDFEDKEDLSPSDASQEESYDETSDL
ncbi:MAG: ribonuclease J [Alphaproteobacteria bacterium]|nr:ribonuclease J [Alphaproteobacteria bacterium]